MHDPNAARPWHQRPEVLLIILAAAMPLSFSTWMALLNNFAVEKAAFTGREIGILQSLREIPGFLAFTAVFVLFVLREQVFAYVALLLLGVGVALTGYFPSVIGLYATTVLMSVGFHYFETMQTALSLQWVDKARAPLVMGRQLAAKSAASLVMFAAVWLMLDLGGWDYQNVYLISGALTVVAVLGCWWLFPKITAGHAQHRGMVLRKRYWLYYALTFMGGARRQIFVVFAGFLMVEKFGYDAGAIALLFLVNHVFNMLFAARIGRLIGRFGERKALVFEYLGLIGVFTAYAFVDSAEMAAVLYVVDHLFFALAIAIKTYFQKIADPRDIAATAGVGFSINHIAAVVIPAAFGLLWLVSPAAVFLAGTAMAGVSLILALNVPAAPAPGNEVVAGPRGAPLGEAAP